jgi:ferrous iron transport protein A
MSLPGNENIEGLQIMTLTDLPVGANGKVISVRGEGSVTRRLMEMGLIPGVAVRMVKAAPFGDPVEVRLRGYSLALRKSEASAVDIAL